MVCLPKVEVLQCLHTGWKALKGGYLVVPQMEGCQLPECPKTLHPSQLVGCQVETLEGRKLETGCARELVAMEIKYL